MSTANRASTTTSNATKSTGDKPKNGTPATTVSATTTVAPTTVPATTAPTTSSDTTAATTAATPTRRKRAASSNLPVARAREAQIAKMQKMLFSLAKRAAKYGASPTSTEDADKAAFDISANNAWKDAAIQIQQANQAITTAIGSVKTIPDTWAPKGRGAAGGTTGGRGENFAVGSTIRIKSDPKIVAKYTDVLTADQIAASWTVTKTTKSKVVARLELNGEVGQFFPRVHMTNVTSAK